jgi:arsenite/tail-anchored protein-transporting ATPase
MSETSMRQYLAENAGLKYIFFGGKGGVGKTVLAGAAALWAARQGKKTLLASTNPVQSLSSLLDQDVFGKPTPVTGAANLDAYEIDTRCCSPTRTRLAWPTIGWSSNRSRALAQA